MTPDPAIPTSRSQATVLVVDDEPGVLRLMERMLTAAGLLVRTATNAQSAVDLFESLNPALVITDVRMPGVDGPTLVGWLRRMRPDVRILFTTGFPSEPFDLLPGRVLLKPFGFSALESTVREMLAE